MKMKDAYFMIRVTSRTAGTPQDRIQNTAKLSMQTAVQSNGNWRHIMISETLSNQLLLFFCTCGVETMISLWMTCLGGLPQSSFVSLRAPGVAFRAEGLHCCKTECLTQLGVRVRGQSTECWDDFSHLWACVPLGPGGSRYSLLSGAWFGGV